MAGEDLDFDGAELIRLLDEMACRKIIGRYGSALDWRDEAALASTVWPDAIIDYGFFKGSGEEFVQAFMPIERAAGRPFHILVTEQLDVHRPFAEAESLGFSLTFESPAPGTKTVRQYWGRYLDRLERRGKDWKIIQRTYIAHGVFDVDITKGTNGTIEGLHVAENLTVDHPFFKPYREVQES